MFPETEDDEYDTTGLLIFVIAILALLGSYQWGSSVAKANIMHLCTGVAGGFAIGGVEYECGVKAQAN